MLRIRIQEVAIVNLQSFVIMETRQNCYIHHKDYFAESSFELLLLFLCREYNDCGLKERICRMCWMRIANTVH